MRFTRLDDPMTTQRFLPALGALAAALLLAACAGRLQPVTTSPTPASGCSTCGDPTEDLRPTPYPFDSVFHPEPNATAPLPGSLGTIRIGVLQVVDALPLYVADERDYFSRLGLIVDFVPVRSADERDRLLAGGAIDAAIDDLVSIARRSVSVERSIVVRFARVSDTEHPVYSLLVAPGKGINNIFGLKGRDLAVAEATGDQYAAEAILRERGMAPEEVRMVAIPVLADRLVALETGQVTAALFPEPFAQQAEAKGAVRIADDIGLPGVGNFVISFRQSFLDQNGDAVRGFLAAVEQAVADVNLGQMDFQPLFIKRGLVPAEFQGTIPIPFFPTAAVPSELQWNSAVDWLRLKSWIPSALPYSDFVNRSYLPRR